jgi:N-acetylglucosamine-6-phosphate deacetylase
MPNYIDLQVNGYLGVSFCDAELKEDDAARVCRALHEAGTAAFLPTVVTSSRDTYARVLPTLARLVERDEFQGRLLGLHLEGPFISPETGYVGAHNPDWTLPPDVEYLTQLQEMAGGHVRLLTIAAELPGADELAAHARTLGIAVSLGHQHASPDDIVRLHAAGAVAMTHLGNGIPHEIPRHENQIWAALACDGLVIMLITDGHHLPESALIAMIRAKGADEVAIVSDAAAVSGLPPGRYGDFGTEVELTPSGLLHNPETGYLAGSSATMAQCMAHLAGLGRFTTEELTTMSWDTPRRILGISA